MPLCNTTITTTVVVSDLIHLVDVFCSESAKYNTVQEVKALDRRIYLTSNLNNASSGEHVENIQCRHEYTLAQDGTDSEVHNHNHKC